MILGKLSLKSRLILAPLEGVSDLGFRTLCSELGAGLTFTEMCRAERVGLKNKATLDLIDTFDDKHVTGLQLLASSPSQLWKALETVEHLATTSRPHYRNIRAIDLNFGCPSPVVINAVLMPIYLYIFSIMR